MNIEEWKNIIKENFPYLALSAEMALSVVSQLFIEDITNPFGLVIVDSSGAGKTIALNFFSESKQKKKYDWTIKERLNRLFKK